MIPTAHDLVIYCELFTVGYSLKKMYDATLTEADKERKKIIKSHVKDRHSDGLKTCVEGDCFTLSQSLAQPELLEQELGQSL